VLARALLCQGEMCAAVGVPALFVALRAERLFLAIADGADAGGRNGQLYERLLGGRGAIVAECEVVLGRAAFVAVALDSEVNVRMLLEERGVRLKSSKHPVKAVAVREG
jgi:hypothetical protein